MIKIEKQLGYELDIVVLVQGDEPMTTPDSISLALKPFKKDTSVNVVNLYGEMHSDDEFNDPNEVKVVIDRFSDAIYFSREPIPSKKKWNKAHPMFKQICVIPFRREYLLKFNNMEETDLERIESIDMLRVLEHGDKVKMVLSQIPSFSVDTKKDLENVTSKMTSDKLMLSYLSS